MPSPVSSLFSAAGVEPAEAVRWLESVPEPRSGVYAVALTEDRGATEPTIESCPLSTAALDELLAERPELTLDGERPDGETLAERLSAFWLSDEVVLYIGLAGTSLAKRVSQYYRTKLGARSPHAGGWFLKTLTVLPKLWVHHAACDDPVEAEQEMLAAFAAKVSAESREQLYDPDRVMPFANLEYPKGIRKRHGISGAKEARKRASTTRATPTASAPAAAPRPARRSAVSTPHLRTQPVTAADIRGGRIRIPRGASKEAFPAERTHLQVELRGEELTSRWDPRYGPPERSGVLGIGRAVLAELVSEGEVLGVEAVDKGVRLT